MKQFPDSYKDLLEDKTGAFAFLATLMPDGSPQLTPLWFDSDGRYIFVNSAKGRIKDKNMRLHPQVAVLIQDPKNPYRFIQIRGKIVEVTEEGALEHIDRLNMKYNQGEHWKPVQGQVRVKYKIEPEHVSVD